ncbi:proline-serine-threonine phosphatase-interacting protein 2 [Otolemur garnettii]|uniref:proline-serine-threonine phosphatase-interacting protein 2 n=1 Tax=Otolemur garnettii TaxID=30611 RepID=UPI000C7F2B8A|nr:proline-serine-threonine phosphatase-interacting protein 2 [Otolemur garnettii]XP_023365969.1 proline-serine-threonine phosphatase-interacting protein 2 [Otolemur garnettii]
MTGSLFKGNFWNADILSTIGYDSIIQHLNNGRKNCKEFEDFLKERAAIEEKYGKDLLSLSRKKPCGQSELNTLKRALEVFKQQLDSVAQSHIQLAQTLREEARKMEEFREKQKLQRKKTELIMDAIHKQKSLQFKKTMDAKKNYEQKCRDKDEAEQAVNRSANLVNPRQQEKLFVKLATSKAAVEDSDRSYMQHINALDKVREEWQSEHIKACEVFEVQECERINFFRNALWLHMNQLSQQCVTSDEMYENVRKSLEMCSIEKDVEYFVNQRKTGQTPPAPIMYENFYCPQRSAAPLGKVAAPNLARRGPLPIPKSLPEDPGYATIGDYSLLYQ